MGILTGIPYIHNHNQTDIFISQGSTHDINQMRSYQFRIYILVHINNSDSTIDHAYHNKDNNQHIYYQEA